MLRQVYTYNYIRAHVARELRRIIVPESSVHKHHPVHSHRSEYAWDGHGRTHGIVYLSAVPYLCLAGHHVRSHAGIWNRKLHEGHGILIAHSKRTDEIADILTINIS